jgi:predicted Zn finger-like uncharacterized protein
MKPRGYPMQFSCVHCAKRYNIDDNKVRGKSLRVKCQGCSLILQLEWPEASAEPLPVRAAPTPPSPTPAPPKEQPSQPEGALSLLETFQRAISSYQKKDYDTWREALRSFVWRDRAWFEQTFQEGLAAHLWERYSASRDAIFDLLKELSSAPGVELREVSAAQEASLSQRLLLSSMKAPTPLYTLHITLEGKSAPLRSWVYAGGAWRLIGDQLSLLVHSAAAPHIPALQKTESAPAASFPNNKRGLQFQLMEIAARLSRSETDPLGLRAQLLRCQTPSSFFTEHFGSRGEQMAARYQELWPSAASNLLHLLQQSDDPKIEVQLREDPSEMMESFTLKHLLPPKTPLAVVMLNQMPLLYWVYLDKTWRYTLFLPSLVQHSDKPSGLLDAAKQMQLILASHLLTERQAEIASLALPNAKQWLSARFPAQVAAALLEEYQGALDEGALREITQEIAERESAAIDVDCQANPYSRELSGYQRSTLRLMTKPSIFGRVDLNGYQLYSFVYAEGAWRWLGKTRAGSDFEPPPLIDPLKEKYGDSPKELERLLLDIHRALLSIANEGSLDAALRWFTSNIKEFLLPVPREWFAQSFSPELAALLQQSYEAAATPEEISGLESLSKTLGIPPEIIALDSLRSGVSKSLAFALSTSFVGSYADITAFPPSDLYQTMIQELYRGEAPLYWARYQGTGSDAIHGAWAHIDGGWRYIGPMSKLLQTANWRQRYAQRFPENAEGLRALFATIFDSFHSNQPLFFQLLTSLRADNPTLEWFAGMKALIPEAPLAEIAKEYNQSNAKEQQALLSAIAAVRYRDDLEFEAAPNEQHPALFIAHCIDHRRGGVLTFFPLCFCDGAWRWLGTVQLQR